MSRHPWRLVNGYVAATVEGRVQYLHRLILAAPNGFDVDHVNGDRLDNRRSNLRVATRSQNLANRGQRVGKRFKGTSWRKDVAKWAAYGSVQNKTVALGCFFSEEDAAAAYDRWAVATHGEFARLNFPQAVSA